MWLRTGDVPRPTSPESAQALVEVARRQRVAGLLYPAIDGEPEAWPEPVRAELREYHHRHFGAVVDRLQTAARAVAALEGAGLRSLPLKGAAVAERLYDSIGERTMADVDLLALDDWNASVRTLESGGFRPSGRADHAWTFEEATTGIPLELHHGLTSCPDLFPVDHQGLWNRSRDARGLLRRVPSSADLLIQLSLHAAFQHGLVLSLGQYLDFRRLAERDPPDESQLLESSARGGADIALYAALGAAQATVDGPSPSAVREELQRRIPRRASTRLDRWLEDPRRLVPPAVPPLGRLRWELSAGRHWVLVSRTLSPVSPGEDPSLAQRAILGARRGLRLARRLARSWRAARRNR